MSLGGKQEEGRAVQCEEHTHGGKQNRCGDIQQCRTPTGMCRIERLGRTLWGLEHLECLHKECYAHNTAVRLERTVQRQDCTQDTTRALRTDYIVDVCSINTTAILILILERTVQREDCTHDITRALRTDYIVDCSINTTTINTSTTAVLTTDYHVDIQGARIPPSWTCLEEWQE